MQFPKSKIALFVGSDITAHLVLNRIVPDIIKRGYEPIIFLPEHKSSKKADLPDLRQAAFVERVLNNRVVYPYIDQHPYHGEDKNLSPAGIARKYSLCIEHVPDVNDPKFVMGLRDDLNIHGGLSIRCFQIFRSEIIDLFRQREFFLNLHPGLLPKYRGVLSTVRAMAAREKEYGWTLHEIDRGIDTGDFLWHSAKKLDPTKTGTLAQIDVAGIGADSIRHALDQLAQGNVLKGYPQGSENENKYTYPDESELETWRSRGIKISSLDEISGILVEKFSDSASRHGQKLEAAISRAIKEWKHSEAPPPTVTSGRFTRHQAGKGDFKLSFGT